MPAVINCEFSNGFPAMLKPPFRAAAATWAGILNSTIPIKIRGIWMVAGMPAHLAAMCVPNGSLWANNPPANIRANTWYVSALADKITQQDQHPNEPDMAVLFNANLNWNAGPNVPANRYDLESVSLHEMAHGLGFLGLFYVTPQALQPPTLGTYGNPAILGALPAGVDYGFTLPALNWQPSIFGSFVCDNLGHHLTNPAHYAPNSAALGAALSGPALYFDQIDPAHTLYTPNPFALFSSVEHLDDGTSLMCHSIGLGVNRRVVDAPVSAIMTQLGW